MRGGGSRGGAGGVVPPRVAAAPGREVVSSACRLVHPLLRPASSPSEGPAAPVEAAAVLMLQQLPAARSHH